MTYPIVIPADKITPEILEFLEDPERFIFFDCFRENTTGFYGVSSINYVLHWEMSELPPQTKICLTLGEFKRELVLRTLT